MYKKKEDPSQIAIISWQPDSEGYPATPPLQQWHTYKYFGGSYINAYFPRVNHFDSSSKLYFGINVSVSKLMHNAPMEAVVSFSLVLWEFGSQMHNFL